MPEMKTIKIDLFPAIATNWHNLFIFGEIHALRLVALT